MAWMQSTRTLSPLMLRNAAPPRIPGKAYVYRIYDASTDELLYVGCTNDPYRRLREHHHLGVYLKDATRFEVDASQGRFRAEWSELIQIQTLFPRDNERLRGRNWREGRDSA